MRHSNALTAFAAAALLLSCKGPTAASNGAGATSASPAASESAGAEASDFTLYDLSGAPVSLSDYLGKKVIVLNFWATWCVPCTMELPHLQKLYESKKDAGLVVLGVAMDGPETVANVGPFARREGLSFPVLVDEETRAVALYNPRRSAPFTVFIDRSGKVIGSREGYTLGDEHEIEKTVEGLLANLPGGAAK